MRRVLAMVWLDWQLFRRERAAIVATVFLPVAVVAILAPIYVAGDAGDQRAGFVVEQAGPVADLLRQRLEATGVIEVVAFDSVVEGERALREREIDGLVVVPAVVESVDASAEVELIGPPQVQQPRGLRSELTRATAEVDVARSLAGSGDGGRTVDTERLDSVGREIAAVFDQGDESTAGADRRRQGAVSAALVGVVVLFTFTNAMARSAVIAGHRDLGIIDRSRASGTRSRDLVAGFVLSLAIFALVQVTVALVAATLVAGVSWPSPLRLGAAAVMVSMCAGAAGALVGTLLPNAAAGAVIGGPLGFLTGMIGGAVWPLEIVPPFMRTVGHLVPQAWAVDALVAAGGLGETEAWIRPTAVLGMWTVGLLALAVVRLHRLVAR